MKMVVRFWVWSGMKSSAPWTVLKSPELSAATMSFGEPGAGPNLLVEKVQDFSVGASRLVMVAVVPIFGGGVKVGTRWVSGLVLLDLSAGRRGGDCWARASDGARRATTVMAKQ